MTTEYLILDNVTGSWTSLTIYQGYALVVREDDSPRTIQKTSGESILVYCQMSPRHTVERIS